MRRNRTVLASLVVAALAAACRDQSPLAPSGAGPGTLTTDGATMALVAIRRASPLATDLSASAQIGAGGGTIKLSSVGLVVTIPKGALAGTTAITVTAPAGANVAYLFQPHGLVFAKPVKIEQDVRYISIGSIPAGATPSVGYFPDDATIIGAPPGATIPVAEVLPASIDIRGSKVGFSVLHFSGYMVSSGGVVPPPEEVVDPVR